MSDPEARLVALALEKGLLSREQVEAARGASDTAVPLEVMLVSLGYLTGLQADELLRAAQEPEETIELYGPCSVLEPLGRGPSGTVHRAFHGTLGCEVALKVVRANSLNAPFLDRFVSRSRRAVGVAHPSLARVHEVGRQEGAVWVARELLPGMPLTRALDGGTPLDPGSAVGILRQVAAALGALHAAGAVHGNLKPENVFLTGGRDIKLADPGLARDGAEFLRRDADLAGRIIFCMPPEQWTDEAGPASDLYACGVLWHYMLTGTFAFAHRWTREIRKNHEEGISVAPTAARAELPPAADVIFGGLTHKDPRGRYSGAEELIEDLDRLEQGRPVAGVRRAFVARPTKVRRRSH